MSSDPSPAQQRRLRLYARRADDGEILGTYLIRADDVLALWEESGLGEEIALPLPEAALTAVFHRYGRPLATGVEARPPAGGDEDDEPLLVPLPGGGQARLLRFQYMPFGWVHPADYLLWESPWPPAAGAEPTSLAAPAPLVASALSALARAAAA